MKQEFSPTPFIGQGTDMGDLFCATYSWLCHPMSSSWCFCPVALSLHVTGEETGMCVRLPLAPICTTEI